MKALIAAVLLMSSNVVFASDHWNHCSNSNGTIRLEHGEIVHPQKNSEENYVLGSVAKKIVLKTVEETCRLEGGGDRVQSLSEETSLVVYNMNVGEHKFQEDFICKEGGSGLPASHNCDEKTVRKSTRYKVK